MAETKTIIADEPVEAFIESVEPPVRREEARILDRQFRKVTGTAPRMWGPAIIGYGEYRSTCESGRAVHWMRRGFSSRKARHSLYLMGGYCDRSAGSGRDRKRERLGRHSAGKSCLYITRREAIDMAVLEDIIAADWAAMLRLFPDR